MSQSSIDPFNRIRGYHVHPTTGPKTSSLLGRASVQHSIRVENHTKHYIASYGAFGLRTYLNPFQGHNAGFVRVEVTITIHQSAGIDYLSMDQLMPDLSEDQRQALQAFLQAQDINLTNAQRVNRILYIYWDVPVAEIQNSIGGVFIKQLGLVLQIHDPQQCASEHHSIWYRPSLQETVVPEDGIHAVFNKHDSVVKGIYINFAGNKPIKICDNLNDPSRPEGLSVVMNGEHLELGLSDLVANGFYLTAVAAAAAHTATNAEQAAAHKHHIAEVDKQIDREEKRSDKDREYQWRETERQDKRESIHWEREFKEDTVKHDRCSKEQDREDRRSDKQFDRRFQLITKLLGMPKEVTAAVASVVALIAMARSFSNNATTVEQ